MSRPSQPRWAVALFVLLFGGGFVLIGALVGVLPLLEQAAQWRAQRDFVPVSASVQEVRFTVVPQGKSDQHFRVLASLSYHYQGRPWQVREVASQPGDTFRAYHEGIYQALEQARRQSRSVRVWVNPQRPEQVALDCSFRWLVAFLHLPIALAFPVLGVGASAALVWLTRRAPEGSAPAKVNPALFACFFAFMWNAVTLPFCIAKLYDSFTENEYAIIPVMLVFPAIGLLLARWSLRLLRGRPAASDLTVS